MGRDNLRQLRASLCEPKRLLNNYTTGCLEGHRRIGGRITKR